MLTGDSNAKADDGVAWVGELAASLQIPSLSTYGLTDGDVGELVEKASRASSMKGNPIALTDKELEHILYISLNDIVSENDPLYL